MSASAVARKGVTRPAYWLVAGALVVTAVIAGDYLLGQLDRPTAPAIHAPLDPDALRAGLGPRTYADAMVAVERGLSNARYRLQRDPQDWLYTEGVARALLARYRLTARAEDLAESDRLLDRTMELAPWPAGPALLRASVSLGKHDLAGALNALVRFESTTVPGGADEIAEAQSIRCEVAFERGQLAQARELCSGDDFGLRMRRANVLAKTGDTAQAAQIIEGLLREPELPPSTVAMLALQRASLAQATGDWPGSGRWVRAADRIFPGYWLSEAYVAQQYALEGDRDEARRRYALLAARTGDADVLDALAMLADSAGHKDEAADWAARAGAAWQARSALLPRAYASHQAEHLLLHGDPKAALALAEADYRRRPFPSAIVHYAFALWRNGDAARSLEVVQAGEAQGFLTADMKLAEAVAQGALGNSPEAGQALLAARRLNPHVDDAAQAFVSFQQD
ncbi:MAG: hypothetical protein ABIT16_05870 [Croceibacterium sp.]